MKRLHELKTWSVPFDATWNGVKPYEIRKDDRDYQVGDFLWLREYSTLGNSYSGRSILAQVTYKSAGGEWGLPPDLCVLGTSVLDRRGS